ncbi:unnamed protein product [Schistosoma spindalis]|nr:unnamed protein product [Schistosoma spindale]
MIHYNDLINVYQYSQLNRYNLCNYYLIWYFILSYIFAIPFHRIQSEITVSLPDTYHSHIKDYHIINFKQLNQENINKNKQNTSLSLNKQMNNIINNSNLTTIKEHSLYKQYYRQQLYQPTEALHFQSGSYFINKPLHVNTHNQYLNELEQYYSNIWFQQRKHLTTSKYRSNLWTTLHVENCYEVKPAPDLLSQEEIHWYERNLFNYDNKKRFSRQTKRKYKNYHKKLPGLKSQWLRNKRNWIKSPKSFAWLTRKQNKNYSLLRSKRSVHENEITANEKFKVSSNTVVTNQNHGNKSALNHHSTNNVVAVITVHKIAIRPSVLILKQGNVQARIQYVMQLHKELTEQYRLILEVRINPEFPPLYIGVIQNVCDYWPANVPQSKCSLKRPRFYQKNTMCFCNMPPGIYRQRVKLNLNNILDELELPRFLVNFLFSDKKLDVHITIKLEMENKDLVGCMKVKLPLQFISA